MIVSFDGGRNDDKILLFDDKDIVSRESTNRTTISYKSLSANLCLRYCSSCISTSLHPLILCHRIHSLVIFSQVTRNVLHCFVVNTHEEGMLFQTMNQKFQGLIGIRRCFQVQPTESLILDTCTSSLSLFIPMIQTFIVTQVSDGTGDERERKKQ